MGLGTSFRQPVAHHGGTGLRRDSMRRMTRREFVKGFGVVAAGCVTSNPVLARVTFPGRQEVSV